MPFLFSSGAHRAVSTSPEKLVPTTTSLMKMHLLSAATIAAAVALGLAAPARADFIGGPSVRVSPHPTFGFNVVEVRWIADFTGDGTLSLFDNPDGSGTPVNTKVSATPAVDHTLAFNVAGVVAADTTYYFKVTHHDPNNNRPDLTNEPPPFPALFTGAQAISNVLVQPDTDSVLISWEANVIGLGHVDFGIGTIAGNAASDILNITDHTIELTGLSPNTTYQFRVGNLHAIDGGTLVEQFGSFTTVPEPSAFLLTGLGLAGLGFVVLRKKYRRA